MKAKRNIFEELMEGVNSMPAQRNVALVHQRLKVAQRDYEERYG